jgi:putative Holliday junction resolvase
MLGMARGRNYFSSNKSGGFVGRRKKLPGLTDFSLLNAHEGKLLCVPRKLEYEGYIVAFDFGTRRIGVAVGQGITETATPLSPLSAHNGVPQWEVLQERIKPWQPQALVVGLPLKMDGSDQPLTKLVRIFIEELNQRTQLPVYGMDERLSSVEARSRLFKDGGRAALQKNSIDSFAAKLILEDWFSRPR